MAEEFAWSSESPYCVGLGPVFGNEAAYMYSDMQFAKQTAKHFWQLAQVESDEYKEEGTLDPRLQLDLYYIIKDSVLDKVVENSEIKLVLTDWLNYKTAINLRYYPLAHGGHTRLYKYYEKSRQWTADRITSSLQNLYFDKNGNFSGMDWHESRRTAEQTYDDKFSTRSKYSSIEATE